MRSARARGVPGELLRALAHLAEPPGPAHAALAAALGLPDAPDAAGYADLFLFQLYPHASVYLGPEGMIGGEASERISGFWRAVGRDTPPEPDHLASLLALYVALADEAAGMTDTDDGNARAALVLRSQRALLEEHVAPWVFAYLDRVRELGGPHHRAWAEMLSEALLLEVAREGPMSRLSSHLEAAPELSDPRAEGAAPFLSGLIAPARTGVLLTRADLGRIASGLGLGLRAGERRYALEHLVAQDARGVLEALAVEAERQAAGHERRVASLGAPAAFLAGRARTTAGLLGELALAAASAVDEARDRGAGASEGRA